MTPQQKAVAESRRLVNALWVTYWVYNAKTYEMAKSAAIIVVRKLMKEYLNAGGKPLRRHDELVAMPKAIYSLKYKKR